MNRLAQEAVIIGLVRRLDERGSWCGETHIQKSAYLLSGLFDIDFDFDFILYKHGPFSFRFRDELASMRDDQLLEREPQDPPYGPRIAVTDRGQELEERFTQTMARQAGALDWITQRVGDRGVVELERLATALWVTDHQPGTVSDRARRLVELKPHIAYEHATAAVRDIDAMREEATELTAA